jgi:hypothetical protein
MPRLYLVNVTRQHFQFAYKALERSGVVTQPVPSGEQVKIAPLGSNDDLSAQEIDYIIGQHVKYGLVSIDEIGPRFDGICYSIGKPASADKMTRAAIKYDKLLDERGKKIRVEAAIAETNRLEQQMGVATKSFTLTVEEEEPKTGYDDKITHVSEGVRVSRSNESPDGIPILRANRGR